MTPDNGPDHARFERMKLEHWQILPSKTLTFAAGGRWCCPDERCGEDVLGVLVPHPNDPEQTPNRCPTCLVTATNATNLCPDA